MVHELSVTTHSAAAPDTLYALLKDPTTWPAWSPMDSGALDTPGADEPYGVGSIRALTRGRFHGLDQVVELVPGRRFSYLHLRGVPVRDYRADVELTPDPGGTQINWRASFRPKYVGTGWFWHVGIARMLSQTAAGLAHYAAERDSLPISPLTNP